MHDAFVLGATAFKDAIQAIEALGPGAPAKLRQEEGILLYPTAGIGLDQSYVLHNHRVRVKTIDLNQSWLQIEERMLLLLKP